MVSLHPVIAIFFFWFKQLANDKNMSLSCHCDVIDSPHRRLETRNQTAFFIVLSDSALYFSLYLFGFLVITEGNYQFFLFFQSIEQ